MLATFPGSVIQYILGNDFLNKIFISFDSSYRFVSKVNMREHLFQEHQVKYQ